VGPIPSPGQSDLHVNQPLTNVSVAYMQSANEFIASKVFPQVRVAKQSDIFWRYSKADWRKTQAQKRAPGTKSVGVGWKFDTGNYFADVYAVHKDVDDQTRSNADSNFNLDRDATHFVTNQLLLKRDLDWATRYFKPGVWGNDLVGGTDFVKYSDGGSDPIGDFSLRAIDFRKNSGFKPNILVAGSTFTSTLKQHPDIIDRIKYTQRGVVTEDLLATLLEIDQYYTAYATVATGPDIPDARTEDAASSFGFIINPNDALLLYAPSTPSIQTPSAGYTFVWTGYLRGNRNGIQVSRWREQAIRSDTIEGEMTYDQKVVCPDMGMYLSQAV